MHDLPPHFHRIRNLALLTLHIALALLLALLVLAAFLFWPNLASERWYLPPLLALICAVSAALNMRAGWRHMLVTRQKRSSAGPDLLAFAAAMLSLLLAGQLFAVS